jgi:PTH1 family peptidyl-tRNA hydrolase
MKLIVGLGNPGKEYAATRHNVGFDVVETLAKRAGVQTGKRMGQARVGEALFRGEKVFFVKPQTFMNLSGVAVNSIARKFKVQPSDIIVVYDDLDLPVGRVRVRARGSSGGHKGVQSIIETLHTNEFPRVRIGIGSARGETVDYVLSRFNRQERPVVDTAIQIAADAVEAILGDGVEAAMNKFNSTAVQEGNGV